MMEEVVNQLSRRYKNPKKITEESEVYSVFDSKNGKEVVLKVIPLTSKQHSQRFKEEGKLQKKLKHSNICYVKSTKIVSFQNTPYGLLVLEKLEMDLFHYLRQKQRLSEQAAKQIFSEICKAVEHCHSNNIVHLDIKPENILLNCDLKTSSISSIKLCDFGFARKIQKTKKKKKILGVGSGACNDETSSGCGNNNNGDGPIGPAPIGTPEYMPPEILSFEKNNNNVTNSRHSISLTKVDIYSLGVLLYVMITGSFPVLFENGEQICQSLFTLNNFTSDDRCFDLVSYLMHEDPEMRPSASQIFFHPWFMDD